MSSIKYAENEISNSTSHEKKRERGRSKNIQLQKHLVCNFHKLSHLPLVVRPDEDLKNKNWF